MAPRSCAQQNLYNNPLANLIEEQNKLAGLQDPVRRLDASSNKVFTLFETPIPLFVLPNKDFFIKFMKTFVEST